MKPLTISGFIHATPAASWRAGAPDVFNEMHYEFSVYPNGLREGTALVCPHELTFAVPDGFDPTAAQIAALEKKKQELASEFEKSVQAINAQLSRLQALTNEVQA